MQIRYKAHAGFGRDGKFYIVSFRDNEKDVWKTIRASSISQVKKIRRQLRGERNDAKK